MSSSDPHSRFTPRRVSGRVLMRTAAMLAALAVLPALSACGNGGFRPLHADLGAGAPVAQQLEAMQIAPIPGRVGQQLRNELLFGTGSGSNGSPPRYRLDIAIREHVNSTLVRRDAEARGEVFNLNARFKVIRLEDNKTVLSGRSTSRASYERFESIYSNVRARRDAENRAAKTMANDLKSRLAAFFATAA